MPVRGTTRRRSPPAELLSALRHRQRRRYRAVTIPIEGRDTRVVTRHHGPTPTDPIGEGHIWTAITSTRLRPDVIRHGRMRYRRASLGVPAVAWHEEGTMILVADTALSHAEVRAVYTFLASTRGRHAAALIPVAFGAGADRVRMSAEHPMIHAAARPDSAADRPSPPGGQEAAGESHEHAATSVPTGDNPEPGTGHGRPSPQLAFRRVGRA